MIAGVCAGIARRFGWSTTVVRVVTVASLLLPGPQILAYAILWLLMPNDRD
jgi:phage shock protein PspC (stress-responsive transcriptional regulator)